MSAQDLFIYFRVAHEHEAAAVAALRELQATWVTQWPGLSCELMRRRDGAGEALTLMEIYRGVKDEQRAPIEADGSRAIARWLIGERHVEAFEPCA